MASYPLTNEHAQTMVDLVEAGKLDELTALAAALEPVDTAYDAAHPMHCDECGAEREPDELRHYPIDGRWQSLCSFCGAEKYPADAALCFRGQARETLRIIREWASEVTECSDDDDIYHMIKMEALALWDSTPMEDSNDQRA